MRPLMTALYAFALLAVAALAVSAQDSGPLKNPGETVAKPKKSADPSRSRRGDPAQDSFAV